MESVKISREILVEYIDDILDNYEPSYSSHPVYYNVLIPLCVKRNLNYEEVSSTTDVKFLLELIENNQLEQKYIDDIIEFSIANL